MDGEAGGDGECCSGRSTERERDKKFSYVSSAFSKHLERLIKTLMITVIITKSSYSSFTFIGDAAKQTGPYTSRNAS